jgi:hypothetical protein
MYFSPLFYSWETNQFLTRVRKFVETFFFRLREQVVVDKIPFGTSHMEPPIGCPDICLIYCFPLNILAWIVYIFLEPTFDSKPDMFQGKKEIKQ